MLRRRPRVIVSSSRTPFVAGGDYPEFRQAHSWPALRCRCVQHHRSFITIPVISVLQRHCAGWWLELALATPCPGSGRRAARWPAGHPAGFCPVLAVRKRMPRLTGIPSRLKMILSGVQVPCPRKRWRRAKSIDASGKTGDPRDVALKAAAGRD